MTCRTLLDKTEFLKAQYIALRAELLPSIKFVATTNLVWQDGINRGKVDYSEVVCTDFFEYDDALNLTKAAFYNNCAGVDITIPEDDDDG